MKMEILLMMYLKYIKNITNYYKDLYTEKK